MSKELNYYFAESMFPSYKHRLTIITARTSDNIIYEINDEMTRHFPNFNGANVEVSQWISYLILHFIRHVIISMG